MYCNELNHIKSKENFSEVWLSLAELVGWPTLVTSGQVGHLIIILGGQGKARQGNTRQGTDSWNNCHLMLFNTPVTLFPFVVHVGQPLITSGLVLTLLSDVHYFTIYTV